MIPQWLLTVTYCLIALLVAVLAFRVVRRWLASRRGKTVAGPGVSRSSRAEDLPGSTAPPAAAGSLQTASARPANVSWEQRRLFERIHQRDAENDIPGVRPDQVPLHGSKDLVFGGVTPALAAMLPESAERQEVLRRELRAAGYYQPHAWHNLAAIRYVGLMGAIILFGAMLLIVPPQLEVFILSMLVVMAMLGWAFPRLFVRSRMTDRVRRIENGIPDMLDMLNMCVSQGLTVPQSLRRISRDMQPVHPDLAQELKIVVEQAEVYDLETALQNFSDRIDAPDVHSINTLLIQTERMGTSVSEALVEYSDNMRETQRQRADQKANQATFRLLFPTVLCLMPAVYMFLLGPAFVELARFMESGNDSLLNSGVNALNDLRN